MTEGRRRGGHGVSDGGTGPIRTPGDHSHDAIARRIRQIRSCWQLSQSDLGVICGTGKNTVSHWEHGRQRPTVSQLAPLVARTGLTLDWIYLGNSGGLPLEAARRLEVV